MSELLKHKKIWIIILIIFTVAIVSTVCIKVFVTNKVSDLTRIEYRTDIEPLSKRFGKMLSIESCFWKAGTIGRTNFGPSAYWIKGYVFVSKENAEFLKSEYTFTKVSIRFEDGITPDITGKNEFNWSYNKELSKKLMGAEFVGKIYFDVENNIFYFDLESN